MVLEKLNTQIESSNIYKFMKGHKKVINIIQGIVIILLLLSINIYIIKDHFIKKEISAKCGYDSPPYKCICEKSYVDNYEEMKKGNFDFILNYSDEDTDG